ncbi:PREDICTED: uncharacterized protein LOC109152193 [Ipomoea nil]|uniref:uncharacterized protein LOC109152193 n=1 Tax=Ipomoea nil TaxID=35883 RepID=UPI000901418F|nr:PREDICTED: uncharacterized protein LOC109152193 [Ipomoea nil]
MDGGSKLYGVWLRAGGRRTGVAPENRWLVLEEPEVAGQAVASVTDGVFNEIYEGAVMERRFFEKKGEVGRIETGREGVTVGAMSVGLNREGVINEGLNGEGESEGVVIIEAKRRRTDGEGRNLNDVSPMTIEQQDSFSCEWDWEKEGRLPYPRWLLRGFGDAVRESGLSNFGFDGCQYTWEKGRGTCNWVREKLDRILVSGEWRDLWPYARAKSVEGSTSDHMPLLLTVEGGGPVRVARRPRFENSWGHIPECRQVVEREWDRLEGCTIGERLIECGRGVWNWGKGQNKGEVEVIRRCKNEMGRLRGLRDGESVRRFGVVQRQYLGCLRNQSDKFRQRAKELWYREGDSNSRFFHNSVNTTRRRNRIAALRDEGGVLIRDEREMGGIMVRYFSALFTAGGGDVGQVVNYLENRVDEAQNAALVSEVTEEEVRAALFAMYPDKSPGPDGLSPGFFQNYWSILGPEVVSFCRLFMNTGKMPERVNDTHIVLIPKCKTPENMSEFRLISLCNLIYRIIAKVLATRLRVLLDSIIDPAQSAFIPGRSIVDNVLIAFESAHCLKRQPGDRGGFGALKIDMSKAYDRVEWGFLCQVLTKMGFSDKWVGIMRECVSSVRYTVLVEGKEWGPVVPERGLRQGDPLSPYLFILVAECLSVMLRVREEEGMLHGLRVVRGAPAISHLFFADDCLLLFRANNFEAEVLRDVLRDYGMASGQEVNFDKSSIVFGRNVHREDKEAVCGSLGIGEQQGQGKYLGLPGYVGRKKKEILGFIRDRVRARVMNWGNRFLSRGGREVLLKTVLQRRGCERRERGRIRWSRWSDLCVPKKYGGMGFRRVREMNLAMLGKQGWNFLTKPNALVTRVFKARYFPKSTFLQATRGSNPSYVWSSIWETQELVRKGVRWRIGNGEGTKVWGDPWLPDGGNPYVTTPSQEYLGDPWVSSLMRIDGNEWDHGVVRDILEERDANLVLSVPLSARGGGGRDSLFWSQEQNGLYSVCSAYRLASGEFGQGDGVVWRGIWRMRVPPKVKCFFWNLCTLRLPTKDALLLKHVPCDPVCVLCGKANESTVHLFANCEFAHKSWRVLNGEWNMGYIESIHGWLDELWSGSLSIMMIEQVVMVAWAIWEARNSMVWHQKDTDPQSMVCYALSYAQNWREIRGRDGDVARGGLLSVQDGQVRVYDPGWIRVTVDVAMDYRRQRMGFGWSVFNWDGTVRGVVMFAKHGLHTVKEAEALGAREALSWIKRKGWERVVLETDAQLVTTAVAGGRNISPFGLIVNDIRELLSQMPTVNFRFVHRQHVMVSHCLAKRALCCVEEGRVEYFDYIPRFVSIPLCNNTGIY